MRMKTVPPEPTGAFVWTQAPWGRVLTCTALAPLAAHFFTSRDLAPGSGADPDAAWTAAAFHLGLPPGALHRLDQVHGCRTVLVDSDTRPADGNPKADALMTDRADVALAVKAADCVPILVADRHRRVVGAVHAGWRGTAQRIGPALVRSLQQQFGVEPGSLVAAIGPSIGACCYEVGPEVRAGFTEASAPASSADAERWFTPGAGDRLQLDLWRANREQLEDAGVSAGDVHVAGLCTACAVDTFFSYRREEPRAGRMLAVIRKEAAVRGMAGR
jgi:YfiH family protein